MTDTYTPVGPFRADEDKMLAAMLLALSQHGEGVPTDIQELLLRGNPQHGVPPGALSAALKAALNAAETPPAPSSILDGDFLHRLYKFLLSEFAATPDSGDTVAEEARPIFNEVCQLLSKSLCADLMSEEGNQ